MIELLGGLLAATLMMTRILPQPELTIMGAVGFFSLYLTLCLGLVAASAIDLEHMILPDSITLGGVALGIASSLFRSEVDLFSSILGAATGFLLIWFPFIWLHEKLRGFTGMGLGDAKLVALAGAWFGPLGALVVLFAGAIQGTVIALAAMLLAGKIDEPAAVKQEREDLHQALLTAEGDERAELLEILEQDPVMRETDGSLMAARIPFGPFLALSVIELTIFYEPWRSLVQDWML